MKPPDSSPSPFVDQKGPQVDTDRYAPVAFDTPPEGLESAAATGEGPDLGTHTNDEHYFREQQGYSEKHARKPIRLRLPAIRLVDTGVPEEVAKLQKYLHELLGHFGWALIKEALPFLVDEDLVAEGERAALRGVRGMYRRQVEERTSSAGEDLSAQGHFAG